jgi:hypothetical protein
MTLPRKPMWIAGGLVAVVAAAVALALFQPWKLVVDQTAAEPDPLAAAPTASASAGSTAPPRAGSAGAPATGAGAGAGKAAGAGNLVYATTTWKSYEHHTEGTVRVYQLPDGRRVLRLMDLDTSNGPDLKVYLSKRVYTSGEFGSGFVNLGTLKGNQGDSNYAIPAGADLRAYKSVVIWCKRFSVAFGAAPLRPA